MITMIVIPVNRIVAFSPKSVEACAQLLIRAIPPPEERDRKSDNELVEYYGSVWEDSFLISRNQNYRNTMYPFLSIRDAFNPVFYGKLSTHGSGTQISVNVSFHPVVVMVSLLFYLLFISMAFVSIRDLMVAYAKNDLNAIIVTGVLMMFLFVWQATSLLHGSQSLETFLHKTVLARKGNPSGVKC